MPRESSIVTSILVRLRRSKDCYVVKLHGSRFGRRGLPDILYVQNGRATFLEVKQPGGKLSPLQVVEIERIRRSGARVFVATSATRALECLNSLEQENGDG